MAATASDQKASEQFVTVPGDRRSEVARTLADPVPQALSLLDQFGLWGNLGVSLLGFTGAIFVLQPLGAGTPQLSLAAARYRQDSLRGLLGPLGPALVALTQAPGEPPPWLDCDTPQDLRQARALGSDGTTGNISVN